MEQQKQKTRNYDNLSSEYNGGFNSGNFWTGRAVSVNVVNDITNAYISKATINIEEIFLLQRAVKQRNKKPDPMIPRKNLQSPPVSERQVVLV